MSNNSFRFGTVGSPKSTPKKPGGSVGGVIRLRELDLGALELGWVRSVRVSEKTCAAIQANGVEQDVLISVHAPYFINLNADDEEWPKSQKTFDGRGPLREPGRRHRHRLPPRLVFRQARPKKCCREPSSAWLAASRNCGMPATRSHCARRPWVNRPCWARWRTPSR